MNELARDALRKHALMGTKQIRGSLKSEEGGLCALGVLAAESPLAISVSSNSFDSYWGLTPKSQSCPICGGPGISECWLIVHLNDDHKLDFLAIANKL